MRTYLYISDAKVDTYLPQFSGEEKRRIAVKLGVNLKVFEASVEGERLPLTNRVHRLEAVEEKLREDEPVGPVEAGTGWIEGTVNATAATFPDQPDLMFFFSDEPAQFLGLAGSAHHVIGNLRPATAVSSMSYQHVITNSLLSLDRGMAFVVKGGDAEVSDFVTAGVTQGASAWTEVLMDLPEQFEGQPKQAISFLARRLTSEFVPWQDKRYTLATPLYLTLEDVE